MKCDQCKGTGETEWTFGMRECDKCEGAGWYDEIAKGPMHPSGPEEKDMKCPTCKGKGKRGVLNLACGQCNGTGAITPVVAEIDKTCPNKACGGSTANWVSTTNDGLLETRVYECPKCGSGKTWQGKQGIGWSIKTVETKSGNMQEKVVFDTTTGTQMELKVWGVEPNYTDKPRPEVGYVWGVYYWDDISFGWKIKTNANGGGFWFKSMDRAQAFADLEAKRTKHKFKVFDVDTDLANVPDYVEKPTPQKSEDDATKAWRGFVNDDSQEDPQPPKASRAIDLKTQDL